MKEKITFQRRSADLEDAEYPTTPQRCHVQTMLTFLFLEILFYTKQGSGIHLAFSSKQPFFDFLDPLLPCKYH